MAWSDAARAASAAARRAHAKAKGKKPVGVKHVLAGVPVGTSRAAYASALRTLRREIPRYKSSKSRNAIVRSRAQVRLTVAHRRKVGF